MTGRIRPFGGNGGQKLAGSTPNIILPQFHPDELNAEYNRKSWSLQMSERINKWFEVSRPYLIPRRGPRRCSKTKANEQLVQLSRPQIIRRLRRPRGSLDSQGRDSPSSFGSKKAGDVSLSDSVVSTDGVPAVAVRKEPVEVIDLDGDEEEEEDEAVMANADQVDDADDNKATIPRAYLAPPARKLYYCINKACQKKFFSSNKWSDHVAKCTNTN